MERKNHPFEALDDIGYWGTECRTLSAEEKAFYAQKAEEARQRYYREKDLASESPIITRYEIPAPKTVCAVAEPSPAYVP
jgi:hypothetical protein